MVSCIPGLAEYVAADEGVQRALAAKVSEADAAAATAAVQASVVLPPLVWRKSPNQSGRGGAAIRIVAVHRWGVPVARDLRHAKATYEGVTRYLRTPEAQASAHVVYPGALVGEGSQLVGWDEKAWTEAYFNPEGESVESADAIWEGLDDRGMAVLARIVAFRCHQRGIPAVWIKEAPILHGGRGICRHADLGSAGGGHLFCPTTDIALWEHFVARVKFELHRGQFRASWGIG